MFPLLFGVVIIDCIKLNSFQHCKELSKTTLLSGSVLRMKWLLTSSTYSIFNIKELLFGHIILQGTYTQVGLIERPLLLPFVKKKCCT